MSMMAQTQSAGSDQACPNEGGPDEPQLRRSWVKLIVLAAVITLLLLVVYLSPLHQYLGNLREMSERLRGLGPSAPLVLAGVVALLVAIGVPRLVFCVLAGMVLWFWSGLFWAQLGTFIGNYISFIVIRAPLREWGQRFLAKQKHFHGFVHQRGALGVILARQLPLPGLLINFGCALLPLRQVDFIVGTIIGQLPQAIPCTLIGAGLLQASLRKSIGLIGLAVALSIFAWLTLRYILHRRESGLVREKDAI